MAVMVTSFKRTYVSIPRLPGLLYSVPRPCGRPLLTHASARDAGTLTGKSGSASCGNPLLPPGSWCTQGSVCALRVSLAGKRFDSKCDFCVDHNKLWKILKEMEIPDHRTCLLRNLYAGQKARVRTGHGTMDWFQIQKGVHQGCMLSPCLFNLHTEYIMRNAGVDVLTSWNQDCREKYQ